MQGEGGGIGEGEGVGGREMREGEIREVEGARQGLGYEAITLTNQALGVRLYRL